MMKNEELEVESPLQQIQHQHKIVTVSMLTKTPSDVMQNDEVEHQIKSTQSISTLEETISLEKPLASIADETAFGKPHRKTSMTHQAVE